MPTTLDMSSDTAYHAITIEKMMDDYFCDCIRIGMSGCPFDYWQEKKSVWEPLQKLALHYLNCPPSSAYWERVFSSAGLRESCGVDVRRGCWSNRALSTLYRRAKVPLGMVPGVCGGWVQPWGS